MAKKVGEFFIEMLVDAASGNLSVKQLIGALGELDVASVGTVGIISKVTETLWGMAKAATNTAVELSALQDITGVDPKIVQQWDKAAERVTHHAGSIVKAIQSVHEIQKRLATGEGPPAALTGILGLSPYKVDAAGKQSVKDAMDLMKEMAAPGSTYRTRSRDVQQSALGQVFGGGAEDIYRVLEQMIAGKFHPSAVGGMDDKQVKSLNRVDVDRIKVGQELTDIFQHLLVSGDGVAGMLERLGTQLERVDKWLESKQGKQSVVNAEAAFGAFFNPRNYNPLTLGEDLAKRALGQPVGIPARPQAPLQLHDLKGRLEIDLRQNGKSLGTKTTFVDRAGTMRDFWGVTDTLGLTP